MDADDLKHLNTARRWWLATMPHIGRVPTDDEVVSAYRDYHANGFVLWHRLDECDAPDLCRFRKA
jgi:hypothetical protein